MRVLVWLWMLAPLAPAQVTAADLLEKKTAARIRAIDESLEGVLGMAAIDLATGQMFSYNGEVVFPQASSIKIPIMIQVFRAAREGGLRLEESITLTEKDAVGGSGKLQERVKKGPVTLTIRGLVREMIRESDNLATNKLIGLVGMDNVNRTLAEMGFTATRLKRIMMDSAAAARDEENVSTPREMARLVELLYRGKVVDETASREMLDIMKTVKADMRKSIPPAVEVAAKPGDLNGVRCETGVVYLEGRPFVLSVMSTFLTEGKNPVPEVTALVYAHFEKLAKSNRYGHRVR